MLATVTDEAVGATVPPGAVRHFLRQAGAVEGLWLADRSTERLLTVTIWADQTSMEAGWVPPGPTFGVLGRRPVAAGDGDRAWARVTRIDGLDAAHPDLDAALLDLAADESRSEGFRGSCCLDRGPAGESLAFSVWDGPHALIRGEHDSKRRRRDLEHRLGARVTNVSELECLALAAPLR